MMLPKLSRAPTSSASVPNNPSPARGSHHRVSTEASARRGTGLRTPTCSKPRSSPKTQEQGDKLFFDIRIPVFLSASYLGFFLGSLSVKLTKAHRQHIQSYLQSNRIAKKRPSKMSSPTDLRKRAGNGIEKESPPTGQTTPKTKTKNGGVGVMDILRILGGLFLLNCLLSYFITNDSVLWGYRPWFVRPAVLMRYLVSRTFHLHSKATKLTVHLTARTRLPNRRRAPRLRRHRPQQTHLRRPERHNLRRHRWQARLRARRQLPRLCGQGLGARFRHRLLRRRHDG
jgi:hypothetical protein